MQYFKCFKQISQWNYQLKQRAKVLTQFMSVVVFWMGSCQTEQFVNFNYHITHYGCISETCSKNLKSVSASSNILISRTFWKASLSTQIITWSSCILDEKMCLKNEQVKRRLRVILSEDLACRSLAIKRNNGCIHNSKDYSENITDKMNYTKFHKIKYNTKAIQTLV